MTASPSASRRSRPRSSRRRRRRLASSPWTLLVHAFRNGIVLRDPRLPAEALPDDWPERRARALFADLYARLSPRADLFVSRTFASLEGPLAAETEATRRRLDVLVAAAAP